MGIPIFILAVGIPRVVYLFFHKMVDRPEKPRYIMTLTRKLMAKSTKQKESTPDAVLEARVRRGLSEKFPGRRGNIRLTMLWRDDQISSRWRVLWRDDEGIITNSAFLAVHENADSDGITIEDRTKEA